MPLDDVKVGTLEMDPWVDIPEAGPLAAGGPASWVRLLLALPGRRKSLLVLA